jgi:hypothetical protein
MNKKEFYFLIFLEAMLSLTILLGLAKLAILTLSVYIIHTTIRVGSRGFSLSWLDFKKFVKEFLKMRDE